MKFAEGEVKKKYHLLDDQISTTSLHSGFEDRRTLRVDIQGGDNIVAALEFFLQLMGNIMIFRRR